MYGGEDRGIPGVKTRGRDYLEDSDVNGRIILRWIFMKWDLGAWNGWSWFRIGQVANTCECGNEPSGSVKCVEILD